MSTLGRQAVRSTMAVLVANTVSRLVATVGQLYLRGKVMPEEFGIVAYAASLLALCDALANWGFSQSATHREERVPETFCAFLTLRIGMLLGAFAFLALSSQPFRHLLLRRTDPLVIVALAITILGEAVCDVQATQLSRSLRFGRLMAVDVAGVVVGTACAVAAAASGWGLWAVVVNRAATASVRLVCLSLLAPNPLRAGYHAEDARWLLRFGLPLWLGSLATTWVLKYSHLVVGQLRGDVVLGHYDFAHEVALLPLLFVTGVLTRVSFPLYARLQGDRARLSEAFRIVSGTTLRLAGPMALGLALALPDLLTILRWEQWRPMTPIVRWFLAYAILRPLMDDAGSLLTAVGRPKVTGHTLVAEALALLVLCPALTWRWGANGAAASVGLVVLGGLGTWYVVFLPRVVDVSFLRLLLPPLVSLGAAAAAGMAVQAYGGLRAGLPSAAATLAAVAVVYLAGILLLDGRQMFEDLKALRRHTLG